MRFLIQVPTKKTLDGMAVIATGSGLDWSVSRVPLETLLSERNVTYENAELRVLSANDPQPKGGLTYGGKLWIDTRPYASSRFTKGYAVVLQDIRDHQNNSVGYIVALPDGQVARVKTDELLAHCEAYRAKGEYFVQNMQYVGQNNLKSPHLKNYEGKVVPVYTLPAPVKTSTQVTTITTRIYVLDIKPETVLDAMVVVEDPHEVQGASIQEAIDKSVRLLKERLMGVKQLTVENESWINNYINFVVQFPEKYALYGLTELTRAEPVIVGYLTSKYFAEKYPNAHGKFVNTVKRRA